MKKGFIACMAYGEITVRYSGDHFGLDVEQPWEGGASASLNREEAEHLRDLLNDFLSSEDA